MKPVQRPSPCKVWLTTVTSCSNSTLWRATWIKTTFLQPEVVCISTAITIDTFTMVTYLRPYSDSLLVLVPEISLDNYLISFSFLWYLSAGEKELVRLIRTTSIPIGRWANYSFGRVSVINFTPRESVERLFTVAELMFTVNYFNSLSTMFSFQCTHSQWPSF